MRLSSSSLAMASARISCSVSSAKLFISDAFHRGWHSSLSPAHVAMWTFSGSTIMRQNSKGPFYRIEGCRGGCRGLQPRSLYDRRTTSYSYRLRPTRNVPLATCADPGGPCDQESDRWNEDFRVHWGADHGRRRF